MRHCCSLILATLLLAAGCATHADRLREVRTQFYQGSVETASITLDKYISNYPREAEAFKLDRAVVELAAGRPKEAEKLLREARDALDYNSQASLAEKAGSMLTDDTHTAYAGEDYEKILVRAMLAISNLMNGGADATAYALQVSDMQERIIASGAEGAQQNPKLSYKRVALGEYIHGAIDEASRIDYNEAARSYTKVCSWEPSFPYGRYDVERAMHGHHSQQGNGVLYVFALVGRGPYKEETVEVAATISMFAASAIVNATANHSIPPSVAPIKVPKVVVYHNSMNSVFVSADGRPVGPTATITDVGKSGRRAVPGHLSPRRRAGGRPSCGQGRHRVRGERSPEDAEELLGQPGHGRRRDRLGGGRIGRLPLLGPAARPHPGAARRVAGRRSSDPLAARRRFWRPARRRYDRSHRSRAETRISWACLPTGIRSESCFPATVPLRPPCPR